MCDIKVDLREQLFRQVLPRVDASIIRQEFRERHLLFDLRRVRVGVEHDDGKGEDVRGVIVGERLGVLFAVMRAEGAHDPVNLLRLTRQAEG